ncbi:hypothetical protein [Pygmaiobacter massiliensis]|uniref:hypothetical protein n=1 Tax=Pygmaiobacter massiliensis TaxID=1917873 RepID=UPI0015E12BBC|nr:hypothetical protein [Pygmaiobacter massiliensis]
MLSRDRYATGLNYQLSTRSTTNSAIFTCRNNQYDYYEQANNNANYDYYVVKS